MPTMLERILSQYKDGDAIPDLPPPTPDKSIPLTGGIDKLYASEVIRPESVTTRTNIPFKGIEIPEFAAGDPQAQPSAQGLGTTPTSRLPVPPMTGKGGQGDFMPPPPPPSMPQKGQGDFVPPTADIPKDDSGGIDWWEVIARGTGAASDAMRGTEGKQRFINEQKVLNREREVQEKERERISALEAQYTDPDSKLSGYYRQLAQKYLPGGDFEGVSAYDLENSMPVLSKLFEAEMQDQALRSQMQADLFDAMEKRAEKEEKLSKEKLEEKRRLSEKLTQAGIPKVEAGFEQLNDMLGFDIQDVEKDGTVDGKKVDLPGVRGIAGLGKKANEFNTVVSNLVDILGRTRSGGAITDDEIKTFQKIATGNILMSEQQQLKQLKRLHDILKAEKRSLLAGYTPDVIEAYEEDFKRGSSFGLDDDDSFSAFEVDESGRYKRSGASGGW